MTAGEPAPRAEEAPAAEAPRTGTHWTMAEATLIRAAGFLHLALLACGLLAPAMIFAPWGLPFQEPATFVRFMVVAYGALGLGLLRSLARTRPEGRLLVETTALVKLGVVAVVLADTLAHKLPSRAPIVALIDLVFGVALFRAARR